MQKPSNNWLGTKAGESSMTKSIRSLTPNLQSLLAVVFLAIVISGCGVEPHSDAPTIKFVSARIDENGVNVFSSNPIMETKIELSRPEDRSVFLEILSNEEYLQGKSKELISGDDWGGKRFKGRSNSIGIANFDIRNSDYNFSAGQTYWVRSGVLIGQRDFGILVSLIEIPIDKRSGHLFETIRSKGEAVRVAFGVSDFLPFMIEKSGKKDSEVSTANNSVKVGMFMFKVPPDWEVLSGNEEMKARREIEASVSKMLESYSVVDSDKSMLGIQEFKAVRISDGAGWFIVYNTRIPPQKNYLLTMEKEQEQKLSWGKQQGIVTRVIEHGLTKIDGSEVVKVDSEMREGARTIGIYHWLPTDPGNVDTVQIVVNPGHYDRIETTLNTVMASLKIINGR